MIQILILGNAQLLSYSDPFFLFFIFCFLYYLVICLKWGFSGGSVVKNPPAMQETWVPSLGREDYLEKEVTTHSSTLAWKIPWTEEPGGLQFMGLQRVGHEQVLGDGEGPGSLVCCSP